MKGQGIAPPILKAAAAIAGLTVENLAINAGVRVSRTKQILGGYAVPKRGEVEQLLDACGIDPNRLTAHIGSQFKAGITSHGADRLRLLTDLLLVQQPDPFLAASVSVGSLFVDKLSLTFNVRNRWGFRTFVARVPQLRRWGNYRHTVGEHGVKIEYDPWFSNQRFALLTFTPTKLNCQAGLLVRKALSFACAADLFVSRIDPAFDLGCALYDVQPVALSKRKVTIELGKTGIETVYLGAKRSRCRYRIYAKDKQTGQGKPTTRVEVQVKPNLFLQDLSYLNNPFAALTLLPLPAEAEPCFETRILIQWCRYYGLAALKQQVDRKRFNELAATLEQKTTSFGAVNLVPLFEQQWFSVLDELFKTLGLVS